jgi:hypothetical protein
MIELAVLLPPSCILFSGERGCAERAIAKKQKRPLDARAIGRSPNTNLLLKAA